MKGYFKYFKIPFIVTAIIGIICIVIYAGGAGSVDTERNNDYYDNSYCVIDWADKLTDEEEQELANRIYELEYESCTDMILITMDEADYGYLDAVIEYAEAFNTENQMGFNGPGENAVVFVDNWSRGGDGKIHSWIDVRGDRASSRLSQSDCEEILNTLDDISSDDADPYYQYLEIMEDIAKATKPIHPPFGVGICIIVGIIVAAIYIFINWKSKLGDVEVNSSTYLKNGEASFSVKQDIFRNKVVTKRKIEKSSSSGGGSGHSGGGHSR